MLPYWYAWAYVRVIVPFLSQACVQMRAWKKAAPDLSDTPFGTGASMCTTWKSLNGFPRWFSLRSAVPAYVCWQADYRVKDGQLARSFRQLPAKGTWGAKARPRCAW